LLLLFYPIVKRFLEVGFFKIVKLIEDGSNYDAPDAHFYKLGFFSDAEAENLKI
jgi:hypothetical protein